MKRVAVEGAEINVSVRGEGPAVLLLHGLFVGSLAPWYFLSAGLIERFTVVCMDLRGHGRSSRPATGYDLSTLASDADQVLNTLGVGGPLAVAGHSYGGLVGLHLSQRRELSSLLLVDSPLPGPSANPAFASPQALLAALPEQVREMLGSGGRRARRLLSSVQALTETTLIDDLKAEPPIDFVPDVPVHLLYGNDSGCLDAEAVYGAFATSKRRVDGGHFLLVENPAGVLESLEASLG